MGMCITNIHSCFVKQSIQFVGYVYLHSVINSFKLVTEVSIGLYDDLLSETKKKLHCIPSYFETTPITVLVRGVPRGWLKYHFVMPWNQEEVLSSKTIDKGIASQ